MRKFMLIIIAIVGSLCGFALVDLFILKITIVQYLFIEVIISGFHWLYNKAKKDLLTNPN
jgi:hypothetical protein